MSRHWAVTAFTSSADSHPPGPLSSQIMMADIISNKTSVCY